MRTIVAMLALSSVITSSPIGFGEESPSAPKKEDETIQITLYPAAEASPVLKYQLLPPLLERRPGNAAVWWNRLPAERASFFAEFDKEYTPPDGRIQAWLEIPLSDPREKAYREKELAPVVHLIRANPVFSDMERAASLESCDWELPVREGNYAAILLPETQQSREYGRLLSAKAHLEIAEGKYDEAIRTLQCGYAEARHVGEAPFVVNYLVGVTIAGMMNYEIQKLIQQPDSPNLYWALTTLPPAVVDFRPGAEAESNMPYLQFPELRDLDKKTLTPEEYRKLLDSVLDSALANVCMVGEKATVSKEEIAKSIAELLPRARASLIEQGRAAAEVDAMPDAQAILLYCVQAYDRFGQDQFKMAMLPYAEAGEKLLEMWRQRESVTGLFYPLVEYLPTVAPARHAEVRIEWSLATLRIFEALRLYAAKHDGQWPDRLSDITEVPIPVNPLDGKPFSYERQGDKAILSAEKSPKEMPRRYEITLMPKKK